LPEDGHIARVATKTGNMIPNPCEGLDNVSDPGIAGIRKTLVLIAEVRVAKGI
jgi:hypothetical protein